MANVYANGSIVQDGLIFGVCPVDLKNLPPVAVTPLLEINAVVERARKVQPTWASLTLQERGNLLKRAASEMLRRRQEALELIVLETGKVPADALLSEIVGPLQYVKDWIRVIRPNLRTRKVKISALSFPGKSGFVEMVPRGVVGVITPWNFPMGCFFKSVFPALLCGNSVVVKPSEYAPRTAAWFVGILNQFLPKDVLHCVQGDKEAGIALVRSGIQALTFTGSSAAGVEVLKLAAEAMIPCSVELGGKDVAIILADCDLDRTVAGVLNWSLQNSGQACGDIERVFVEEEIADRFVEKLTQAVMNLRVHSGEPTTSDVGPSANPSQFKIVNEHVENAIALGASLKCGGKPVGKGLWFEPTVLDYCNQQMKVLTEPTFGPVIPIMRVPSAAEAVRLSNLCDYGLNASIWSSNISRATEIAKQLEVGTVYINNHAFTGAIPDAPWTGVKKSGFGIANSSFSMSHYMRPRTLIVDRRKKVDAWWLPMNEAAEELGHRLAEAQLGQILSALRLPFLISKRENVILKSVQKSGMPGKLAPQPARRKISFPILPQFGLTRFELSWAHQAITAIYTDPSSKLAPVPHEESIAFITDLFKHMPWPAKIGIRASIWFVQFAPFLSSGKLFSRLSLTLQTQFLQRMASDGFFLQRQFVLLLKINGALSEVSTTRLQRAINVSR